MLNQTKSSCMYSSLLIDILSLDKICVLYICIGISRHIILVTVVNSLFLISILLQPHAQLFLDFAKIEDHSESLEVTTNNILSNVTVVRAKTRDSAETHHSPFHDKFHYGYIKTLFRRILRLLVFSAMGTFPWITYFSRCASKVKFLFSFKIYFF